MKRVEVAIHADGVWEVGELEHAKGTPRIKQVSEIRAGVLTAPPAPMSTNEIAWSRRSAMQSAHYLNLSKSQQNALLDGVMKWGTAHRYLTLFSTESGAPAGSGVCVTSGGRRGILTARHVLYTDLKTKARAFDQVVVLFAPPQLEMLLEQRRRQFRTQDGRITLGPCRVTGISVGDHTIYAPDQQEESMYPDPGLPDIAIIVLADDIEERLREAAQSEGTTAPEPQWLDLDREELVSIPYGPTSEDDEMLMGPWQISGLRGERSDVLKLYGETDWIVVDRIYRRSMYEYYGIFVDEVGGTRAQSRGWKGTSGGGVWQQRLTPSGQRKIEQYSAPSLTPEDLEPPVLGGIAFFHETRKSPQDLRAGRDGTTQYRGELYAHRIGGTLLDVIRRAFEYEVKVADMGERDAASAATVEVKGS